jgi:hypothetical protein
MNENSTSVPSSIFSRNLPALYILITLIFAVGATFVLLNHSEIVRRDIRALQKDVAYVPEKAGKLYSFTNEARGCGNITVYRYSDDGQAGLSVQIGRGNFKKQNTKLQAFDIASGDASVTIAIGEQLYAVRPGLFCNDFIKQGIAQPEIWEAKSGTVTVQCKENCLMESGPFTTDIKLENITFYDTNGIKKQTIDNLLFEDVEAGWWPG